MSWAGADFIRLLMLIFCPISHPQQPHPDSIFCYYYAAGPASQVLEDYHRLSSKPGDKFILSSCEH
jgi:hypothetical protein